MMKSLEGQLAQLARLPGLRVVIPTGAGRVFSAGGLVEFEQALNTIKQTLLFYTAGLVDAQTLKDWGLINEVVPRERLMDRAMEIARDISLCSPEAIRHIKYLTGNRARTPDRQARIAAELERFALHVDSNDLAQGLAAFSSKLPVQY